MAEPTTATDFLDAPPLGQLFTEAHRSELADSGITVVSLFNADECAALAAELRTFITALSPSVVFGDPSTYDAWPADAKGMQQAGNAGQLRALWKIRQDPRVVQVFAEAFRVPPRQLLVSMDTFAFIPVGRPSALSDTEEGERQLLNSWTHWDENNLHDPAQMHTLQGMLVLVGCEKPDQGGLLVYKLSHHVHHRYLTHVGYTAPKEFYVVGSEALGKLRADCRAYLPDDHPLKNATEPVQLEPTRVAVPAGSLVLWSSRTLHRGVSPVSTAEEPSQEERLVAYVCMTPSSHVVATDSERDELVAKRVEWLRTGKATNHSGTAAVDPSRRPGASGTFGDASHLLIRSEDELTPIGRSLLGLPHFSAQDYHEQLVRTEDSLFCVVPAEPSHSVTFSPGRTDAAYASDPTANTSAEWRNQASQELHQQLSDWLALITPQSVAGALHVGIKAPRIDLCHRIVEALKRAGFTCGRTKFVLERYCHEHQDEEQK